MHALNCIEQRFVALRHQIIMTDNNLTYLLHLLYNIGQKMSYFIAQDSIKSAAGHLSSDRQVCCNNGTVNIYIYIYNMTKKYHIHYTNM